MANHDLITLPTYKAAVDVTDTTQDGKFSFAITAASEAIRSYIGRDVGSDPVTEQRKFRYDQPGFCEIDDCAPGSITAVSIDQFDLAADEWVADGSPNNLVWTWLEIPRWHRPLPVSPEMGFERNLDYWMLVRGRIVFSFVYVTATWGWTTVPADLQQAAIWLTANFVSNPDQYVAESIEGYSRTSARNPQWETAFTQRITDILDLYRRESG